MQPAYFKDLSDIHHHNRVYDRIIGENFHNEQKCGGTTTDPFILSKRTVLLNYNTACHDPSQ